jgi:hypothetical protein
LNRDLEPYRLRAKRDFSKISFHNAPPGDLFASADWTSQRLGFRGDMECKDTSGKIDASMGIVMQAENVIQETRGHA